MNSVRLKLRWRAWAALLCGHTVRANKSNFKLLTPSLTVHCMFVSNHCNHSNDMHVIPFVCGERAAGLSKP